MGALLVAAAAPSVARAAACPGADPCPYASAGVVGRRAGGAFRFPQGVAAQADGRIYVADQFGRDVQVFAADGTPQGDFGTQGTGGGQFSAGIGGLAIDPASQDVYAVDSRANRIEEFHADGTFVRAFGSAGTGAGQFSFGGGTDSDDTAGGGVVVGGGKLYVVDTLNSRVQRMNLDGSAPEVLSVPAPGGLNVPEGAGWTDAAGGELYVADNRDDRIVVVHPDATATTTLVAVNRTAGTGPDGQPGLDQPYDVAVDPATQQASVASDQNSRLVRLGPPAGGDLPFLGVFGTMGPAAGQIAFPRSIALAPNGDALLAEASNNRVQEFAADGSSVRSIGFAARAGVDFTLPQGLAADPYGAVLTADTFAYRGLAVQADGTSALQVGPGLLQSNAATQPERLLGLADLAPAPDGTIVALDSRARRVVRYDAQGKVLGVLATGVASSRSGMAEGGIAVAPDGGVWVADSGGNRIERLDPASGAVTATIGSGGTAAGQLSRPDGLRIDAAGDLWVADSANHRVQELAPDGTPRLVIDTAAGATTASEPEALALDGRGLVYVADTARSDVAAYRTADGAKVAQWGERGVATGQFVHPRGIAVGCDGAVTVADTDANRLQRFVLPDPGPDTCVARPPAPPPPAPAVVPPPPPAPVPAPAAARPAPKPAAPRAARVVLRLTRTTGALGRTGLPLRLTCSVACAATPSVTLAAASGGPGLRIAGGGRRRLEANRAVTVRLRASASTVRALRRRLGRRRALRLTVRVTATRTGAATSRATRRFRVAR